MNDKTGLPEHLLELFRRNDIYWQRLMLDPPKVERGGVIEFSEVKEKSRIDNPARLKNRLIKWLLRDHGIHAVQRGECLYLQTEVEQAVDEPSKRVEKIRRAAKKVIRIALSVDPLKLSEGNREKQARHAEVARALEQTAKRKQLGPKLEKQ